VYSDQIEAQQRAVCERYGCIPYPADPELKLGIARNVKEGKLPINGMRIPPEGDTTGWYVWGGEECSDDPDFFVPLHVTHLPDWCPAVLPYLQLSPGWRFLIAPGHEDVWFDESLLKRDGDSD
jgi:hypothetical protein